MYVLFTNMMTHNESMETKQIRLVTFPFIIKFYTPWCFKRHSIFEPNVVFSCPRRKSLKSLFFLLPLLGVTNILHHLWPNPLRGSWPSFAIWSFTTHFLYSFQGVFVASVYFLFDKKVVIETKFFRICYHIVKIIKYIKRNTTSKHIFVCPGERSFKEVLEENDSSWW